MNDRLIKESDVLKAIDKRIKELSKHPEFVRKNGHIDVIGVKKYILAIPSADRPQGEWIKATGMMPPEFHGHHCCSECGNFANMETPFGNREDLSRFCPNCGAKMCKGGDDE